MHVILVIGGAQQGKTPYIKKYSRNKRLLVFDVQNEYGNKVKYAGQKAENLPTDNSQPRSRFINLDVREFIEVCKKKRNTICVFEEATMFFQGATGEDTRMLIFGKAHTHNNYILVFHSINSVPPRIMEGTDYVVLFKTNDEYHRVETKYPRLINAFVKLQSMKDGSHLVVKTLV